MSDAKVMDRARELGMVLQEEPDIDLSALSGTPSPTGEAGMTPTPSQGGELTPVPTQNTGPTPPEGEALATQPPDNADTASTPSEKEDPTPQPEKSNPTSAPPEDGSPTQAPTEGDEPAPTGEGELSGSGETTKPTQEADNPADKSDVADLSPTPVVSDEKVSITIFSGMSSEAFAYEAQRLGLVEDALALDRYLVQNGYSKYIRAGTYRIKKGSTYEEIAKRVAMLPETGTGKPKTKTEPKTEAEPKTDAEPKTETEPKTGTDGEN